MSRPRLRLSLHLNPSMALVAGTLYLAQRFCPLILQFTVELVAHADGWDVEAFSHVSGLRSQWESFARCCRNLGGVEANTYRTTRGSLMLCRDLRSLSVLVEGTRCCAAWIGGLYRKQ